MAELVEKHLEVEPPGGADGSQTFTRRARDRTGRFGRSRWHLREQAQRRSDERKTLWKTQALCATVRPNSRRCAMSQLDVVDNMTAPDEETASPAYVPPLQRTAGQPPPIAANGGLSYMSFDRDGDAGTAKAIQDAL